MDKLFISKFIICTLLIVGKTICLQDIDTLHAYFLQDGDYNQEIKEMYNGSSSLYQFCIPTKGLFYYSMSIVKSFLDKL